MDFTKYPFGIPATVHNAEKINNIIRFSYETQEKCGVSNACGIINIILHRCITAAGIQSEIVYGVLNFPSVDPSIKPFCLPHVWLNINEHIVDNTVNKHHKEHLIQVAKNFKYDSRSPKCTDGHFLGDHDTANLGIGDHNIEVYKWVLSNQEKFLALSKNVVQLQRYYDQMIKYMTEKHSVKVKDLEDVGKTCWGCFETGKPLKSCSICKVAAYCDKTCQKKDIKMHRLVCMAPKSY